MRFWSVLCALLFFALVGIGTPAMQAAGWGYRGELLIVLGGAVLLWALSIWFTHRRSREQRRDTGEQQ